MEIQKSVKQAATVARFTLKEAQGNRLAWVALAIFGLGLGLVAFLGEITLTETRQTQAVLVGEFYRLGAAFLISAFVITSMVREFNDKVLELLLALPMTRTAYYFGKYGGFSIVALALALLLVLPLIFLAGPGPALLWGAALAMESLILTALCLLCVFTFSQVVPALWAVFACYLLARSMASVKLMAAGPLREATPGMEFMEGFLELIACLLPSLDRFARGEWLAYGTGTPADLIPLAVQAGVFVALASAAGLFDFHRRNL